MFLFHNRQLDTISDLFSEDEYKMMFVREKHPWIIGTKFILHQHRNYNHDPDLVREVYTQHWDPYYFNHFSDYPVE
jgi:hypothetical protein